MARKKKEDIGLAEILAGENGFVKAEDLLGNVFTIHSFSYEKVKGYDSQAVRLDITFEGEKTTWSTFSKVVQEQVEKISAEKLLPCEVMLGDKPSKNKRHGNYLTLEIPK